MITRPERLQASVTDTLDPDALLRCQFGGDVVRFAGERLTLNEKGSKIAEAELANKLKAETRLDRGGFDFRKWLRIEDLNPGLPREGDNLEYGTACALLLSGVPCVRRGIELLTNPSSTNAEGELDLVFNRRGRLWVVDCKDKAGEQAKTDALQNALLQGGVLNSHTRRLLDSIAEDLRDREIKILREDLLQIAEVGGLLGCALAVRGVRPPKQAFEFAASRHPQVEVLVKDELVKRLPAILAGRRAA
jgi:hypothetical protein